MKPKTNLPTVRQWCQSLGVLTAISISRAEAEMKLAAFVPLLMREFPDAAFNTASLEYVARQCAKGFPTYAELIGYLSDWWKDQRPPNYSAITDQATNRSPHDEMQLRHDELRREWDNPDAIRNSLDNVRTNPLLLNLLRAAVNKFAPQHAHIVQSEKIP